MFKYFIISCCLILVFKTTVFEDTVFLTMRAMDVSFGTSYYAGFFHHSLISTDRNVDKANSKIFQFNFRRFPFGVVGKLVLLNLYVRQIFS